MQTAGRASPEAELHLEHAAKPCRPVAHGDNEAVRRAAPWCRPRCKVPEISQLLLWILLSQHMEHQLLAVGPFAEGLSELVSGRNREAGQIFTHVLIE